jgi:hypothetical protein
MDCHTRNSHFRFRVEIIDFRLIIAPLSPLGEPPVQGFSHGRQFLTDLSPKQAKPRAHSEEQFPPIAVPGNRN